MSMSASHADAVLSAALNSPATPYVQLHTGDPGAAGTANVAVVGGTDPAPRKAAAFGVPGNHPSNIERRVVSTAEIEWLSNEIDPGQTITHFSIWSAATSGDCLYIAQVTESKVVGGDGVIIPSGDLEVAIGVYAKP